MDENSRKFSLRLENIVGEKKKPEIVRYKQFLLFPHSVFKKLLQQTRKNQGLFGGGLNNGKRLKIGCFPKEIPSGTLS